MNSLLAAYVIYNEEHFTRIKIFGDNKSKLAMLLFGHKLQNSNISMSNEMLEDKSQKKFSLELSEEDEARLEAVYSEIQNIKSRYDFCNLDNYISSVMKNYTSIDRSEKLDVEKIRAFLDKFCLSNFFKHTSHITNINYLNFKDDKFVRRFEFILLVS